MLEDKFEVNNLPGVTCSWRRAWWTTKTDRPWKYIIEWKDEPEKYYLVDQTVERSGIVAGPFHSFDVAAVAYFFLFGDRHE